MEKIKGYTKEEAKELVAYITHGKSEGKTLTSLFESYGKTHGRAKGSVRNYYYALLKSKDENAREILSGTGLKAESVRSFTESETEEILEQIIARKQEGLSVRKAILSIAGGDEKLMLRLQNKYRNVAKKEPDRIRRILLGLSEKQNAGDILQRRIENEIDGLYERVALGLRAENSKLRKEADCLREENKALRELLRIAGRKEKQDNAG